MFRKFMTVVLLCLAAPAWAESLVPTWTWGPALAFTAVRQSEDGTYHNEFLTGGAGVQINCNFVDAAQYPWLGVSMPVLLSGESSTNSFRISPGLVVTLIGNLSFGATYDLFKSVEGEGTGLMTGQSDWQGNGTLLFGVTLPWSGGSNAAMYTAGR